MNLFSYVLRRLFYIIPLLLGVSAIIFILFNVVAPDPTLIMLGKHATTEQMIELRRELGLDRSWFVQYLDIVKSAFTFDFGRSWNTKQDIFEMIKNGAPASLSLSVPAFFIETVLSIALALVVSYFRGRWIDRLSLFISTILMSVPSLAYILFGQWFFAYKLGWFEISGYTPGFPHFIPYIILPMIIWVMLGLGPNLRFYRTIILDEVYSDYIRTARAKGLSEKVIFLKHLLKNSMIPIITHVVIDIPFLILGAILLETFFSIPGLGSLTITAVNSSDFPVIKAMTILSAVAYILFSLLSDVLYTLVDPRVRLK